MTGRQLPAESLRLLVGQQPRELLKGQSGARRVEKKVLIQVLDEEVQLDGEAMITKVAVLAVVMWLWATDVAAAVAD